ncbi:adhesion G protein-coupled receptor G3-like [Sardina pilchardus]|uniref:adhesion G protein-coupled receptor G3-like n=1 Tax=Sardina pilchardus TaxID=27697 RepID=UPI002E15BD27
MMWGQAIRGILGMICFIAPMGQVKSESDLDFKMCGTWHHGSGDRILEFALTKGCGSLHISANETTLSIRGSITASHEAADQIQLGDKRGGFSPFCVLWEPLVDRLRVEVDGKNRTVLRSAGLQEGCCTDLSPGKQDAAQTSYGIANGTMRTDVMSFKTFRTYEFDGQTINCKKEFCADEATRKVNMIEEAMMKSDVLGIVNSACFQGEVVEMDDNFTGRDIAFPGEATARGPRPSVPQPSVHLPASLKPETARKAKVVCTFFKNNTIFNKGFEKKQPGARILEDVVGISVENEIIIGLPEPVKIGFHHRALPKNHSRTCVSWDTRTAPEVDWKTDGCKTVPIDEHKTECHCNHLTYFSILVQIEQRDSQCHLEALTFITAVGCAVSALSCVILFYSLCKKSKKKSKDQSAPIHRGLVVTLFFLSMLFILTGVLANVGGESMCRVVGALLHYALLASFCWMAVEIFHTFWMVYMIFSDPPKPFIWCILGFGIPAVPVAILVSRDDIYGLREVRPSGDVDNPYKMCWMKDNSNAWLAHYLTNVAFLLLLISTGLVMLFVVLRKIRNRDEWRKRKLAFLSMWGLSCLYGTTWAFGLLEIGPYYCPVTFLFCIINTLQGFFIMLRYYVLERIRNSKESILDGSSSGSTRQHMLQPHGKGASE